MFLLVIMSDDNEKKYARRRKKCWIRDGKLVHSKKSVGAPLWKIGEDNNFTPDKDEINKVIKKGSELVEEVKRKVLKKYDIDGQVVLAGSTNKNVCTFVSGDHDYDIFVIVDKKNMSKVRSIFEKEFSGGTFQGRVDDPMVDLKPYNVKRKGEDIDYGCICPEHERYASVKHTKFISKALKKNPELREQIIKMKYEVKKRKIDIKHGGITSAAISMGIIKFEGMKKFVKWLIENLEKWMDNNLKDEFKPYLGDPCLEGRNLLATMPGDRGTIKRIIRNLKDLIGLNVKREAVKKNSKLIKIEMPEKINKLPQEIIAQAKSIAKSEVNKEQERICINISNKKPTEVFVTIKNDILHIYLPRLQKAEKQKVYLPLEKIPESEQEEAIRKFKSKHNVKKDEKGLFYIRDEKKPNYKKIKNNIKSKMAF